MKEKLLAALAYRWLATVFLIILLDIITFLAFAKTSGRSGFAHQDKVLHALTFMVLTVVGHLSLNFDFFRKRRHFSALVLVINVVIWSCYGLLIELGQKMLQYRQASMGDFVADLVGIVLGTFLIIAMRLYPMKKEDTHGSQKGR